MAPYLTIVSSQRALRARGLHLIRSGKAFEPIHAGSFPRDPAPLRGGETKQQVSRDGTVHILERHDAGPVDPLLETTLGMSCVESASLSRSGPPADIANDSVRESKMTT